MKDLVITGRQVRRELWILLGCFVAGCLVNVYAIVHYGRPASELYSQIGYVLVLTVVLYVLLALVRLLLAGLLALVRKIRR